MRRANVVSEGENRTQLWRSVLLLIIRRLNSSIVNFSFSENVHSVSYQFTRSHSKSFHFASFTCTGLTRLMQVKVPYASLSGIAMFFPCLKAKCFL